MCFLVFMIILILIFFGLLLLIKRGNSMSAFKIGPHPSGFYLLSTFDLFYLAALELKGRGMGGLVIKPLASSSHPIIFPCHDS